MRHHMMLVVLAILICHSALAKEPKKPEKAKQPKGSAKQNDNSQAEAAIRKLVDSYVEDFNAGDAKAVALHWASSAVYLSRTTGERVSGREDIQKQMEAMFADTPGLKLEVSVDSIRLLSDSVAVEDGTARFIEAGTPPTETTYTAIHIKENGKWKMDSVRETVIPSVVTLSNYKYLSELEWMIGQWIDDAGDSTIETKCEWTKNRNFITRSFKASIQGQIELEGTQVIGWDPSSGTIRSWMFDSDGGFGEGTWERNDNRWIVKLSQVLPDGGKGSSVNIFTYIDNDTFTWQSIGRQIDGEFVPNVEEVTVVRKK